MLQLAQKNATPLGFSLDNLMVSDDESEAESVQPEEYSDPSESSLDARQQALQRQAEPA